MGPWDCESRTDGLIRRNGADDESARGDFESDGREPEVVGSGRDHRGFRPDDEAVAGALPGGWLRWALRSPEAAAESEAGCSEDSRNGVAVISGEVLRFQRAAFPRKADRGTLYPDQLHVGEA